MKFCFCLIALSLFCLVLADVKTITVEVKENPKRVEDFVFKGKESVSKGHRLQYTNGRQATNTQFPFVAELAINTATGGGLCTGSLISISWILTARHCVADSRFTSIRASMGAADRSAARTQILVSSATWQNFPTGYFSPDIALFRLAQNVPITTTIKPIRLPKLSFENFGYDNYVFTAIGWGLVSTGVYSRFLQYTTFKIIPTTTCNMARIAPKFGPNVMCSASTSGISQSLGGDSGGPAVIVEADGRETQIGINIGYVPLTTVYQGTVKVTSYLRWIQQITGIVYN